MDFHKRQNRKNVRSDGDMTASEGGEACLTRTQPESDLKKTRPPRKRRQTFGSKRSSLRIDATSILTYSKQHAEIYKKKVQTNSSRRHTGAD